MNTAKHTPGPWVVRHDDMVCSKEGRIIADCESTSYNMRPAPPIAEDKANAALIAAAPAMYEALKAIQEKISGADVLFDPNPQWEGEQARYDAAQEALFLVDQALAQAEGK